MAFNFPGRKFFTSTDAKTRVFVVLAGVVGLGLLVFLGVKYFGGEADTTGPSKVAGTPQGLTSVPGGQLSPEYYRALQQANVQSAQKAQMTGGSAVATMMNVPGQQAGGNCTILCPSDENANVSDDLNALVKAEKLSQKDADYLNDLAKKNVSVDEYAAALAEMVRQGKLTPEQARALLEKYKKQHENALLAQSANAMDQLIKSGQLPLDVANTLLDMQKRKLTPAEYAAELQRLVREGKLSPEAAAALLAQYTQQYQKQKAAEAALALKKMATAGQITPDTAQAVQALMDKNTPVDQFKAALDTLVQQGKLIPAVAARLLDNYRNLREGLGRSGILGKMLSKGGPFAEAANRLLGMQGNNASIDDYTNELKKDVAAGLMTPEEAAQLLREYQAMLASPDAAGVAPTITTSLPTTEDFAALAARVQQPAAVTTSPVTAQASQFAVAQAQAESDAAAAAEQARLQRIEALQTAMSAQAQSLIVAWQPTPMVHKEGSPPEKRTTITEGETGPQGTLPPGVGPEGKKLPSKPIIKAGTIYFAILDTAVDSDYPDTPVAATIVQGPFKGAKLLGKLALAQGMDKVSLNFTLMDMEGWADTKSITAFAIDPDTARTVMASEVDHHYLTKYGALMATSFLTGYSSAITNAGTSTTGIFGTSSTHNDLSPGNKIAVGLGQVGTNLTNVVQNFTTMPTTVRVTAGVGLGILFTNAVTE